MLYRSNRRIRKGLRWDWEESRIVPDTMRAFMSDRPVRLRSPRAIRPWQHVLEPLRGYLLLAEFLCEQGVAGAEACARFDVLPELREVRGVLPSA